MRCLRRLRRSTKKSSSSSRHSTSRSDKGNAKDKADGKGASSSKYVSTENKVHVLEEEKGVEAAIEIMEHKQGAQNVLVLDSGGAPEAPTGGSAVVIDSTLDSGAPSLALK